MPRGDGTGPSGRGPMTGGGRGYCVLKLDPEDPSHLDGMAGADGHPVHLRAPDTKEAEDMPGGDGTGPTGVGPMSGRAAGYRTGNRFPGYMNAIPGRGRGRGGWARPGRGLPAWRAAPDGRAAPSGVPYAAPWPAQANREQEAEDLRSQAEYLESALGDIRRRIEELKAREAGK